MSRKDVSQIGPVRLRITLTAAPVAVKTVGAVFTNSS